MIDFWTDYQAKRVFLTDYAIAKIMPFITTRRLDIASSTDMDSTWSCRLAHSVWHRWLARLNQARRSPTEEGLPEAPLLGQSQDVQKALSEY